MPTGPGRVNQLGGLYINGKPLPKEIREEIVELARLGVRPCDISRRLKITHGCISKLLSKYQKTGSINPGGANVGRPRVITPKIEQKIEQYRREQPGIFSWELRDRLLQENICSRENLPSLSSISRLIKQKMMARVAGKTNEGNSRMRKNISCHSIDDILNHQVKEQTGFHSSEGQGIEANNYNHSYYNHSDNCFIIQKIVNKMHFTTKASVVMQRFLTNLSNLRILQNIPTDDGY